MLQKLRSSWWCRIISFTYGYVFESFSHEDGSCDADSRMNPRALHDCVISDLFLRRICTYLYPSLPVEHRPSTTPCHRTLFWSALVIPDQLVPCCFSSASVSRLQLLRGRPLFLFPCGFQVRARRVVLDAGFLRVCPIQPHFLRSICLATGSCPARSHRSSFRIFSCTLGFVDAPQTGVEECLDLSLHRLCCPLCLTSVKQD